MLEFLKAYPYVMYVVLIAAQSLMVYLFWPRPVRKGHVYLMYAMVLATTAVPLLFALVASEVYK